jgi:hypothetical protein
VEAVPRDPYGGFVSDLLLVEKNMQLRRLRLHAALKDNEVGTTTHLNTTNTTTNTTNANTTYTTNTTNTNTNTLSP